MISKKSFIERLEFPRLRKTAAAALCIMPKAEPVMDINAIPYTPSASLVKGQITAFTSGLTNQEKRDVEYTMLAAQLNSDMLVKDNQTLPGMKRWFKNYADVLSNLGWILSFDWEKYSARSSGLSVDKVIFEVLAAVATENGAAIAKAAIEALLKLPQDDGLLNLFRNSTMTNSAGKFLLGVCSKDKNNDSIALAFGAFAMDFLTQHSTALWVNWKSSNVNIFKDQKIGTFNQDYYASNCREALEAKLRGHAASYVADLKIGF
jgi:hypothetical protein